MKFCFEGPSGIGKTTLCQSFQMDYQIIPEVNELFRGATDEGRYWYYDRQVERYQMSLTAEQSIFDGDVFQPLWYNWSYNYPEGYLSLENVVAFYRAQIGSGRIFFPDVYFVFQTSVDNLRSRKARDQTRKRRNFEKHLKLVSTQASYFGYLQEVFPDLVVFVDFKSVAYAQNEINDHLTRRQNATSYDSQLILSTIASWLATHNPELTSGHG